MTDRRRWLDEQYSPSRSARDPQGAAARWLDGTNALRKRVASENRRLIRYGERERNQVELFLPQSPHPVSVLVFLHGGWWQEGSIDVVGFPAQTFLDAGIGWASIGYTLAPEATLHEIVLEVDAALAALVSQARDRVDTSNLLLSGHSAGAHLAAAHAVRVDLGAAQTRIASLLLLSGAYDLEPVQESYVNQLVRMSPEDAIALSPLRHGRPRGLPITIAVGADETEEFVRNSRALHRAWSGGDAVTQFVEVSGRDHFDLLDELAASDGVIAQCAVGMLRASRS